MLLTKCKVCPSVMPTDSSTSVSFNTFPENMILWEDTGTDMQSAIISLTFSILSDGWTWMAFLVSVDDLMNISMLFF